jgi:hypothetical protein
MMEVVAEDDDPVADEAGRARRRAAIAEALDAVQHGPRIPISENMSVPLRLLGTIQAARD